MDLILKERLAVNLCAADMNCGFISVTPVLDNRDELVAEQLSCYRDLLAEVEILLTPESVGVGHNAQDEQWRSVIELVAADLICGAISLNPVLYDRAEKIRERIIFHFSRLNNFFAIEQKKNVEQTPMQDLSESMAEEPGDQVVTPTLTESEMTDVSKPMTAPVKVNKRNSKPVRKKNKRKKK